jgi:hypothetical protein
MGDQTLQILGRHRGMNCEGRVRSTPTDRWLENQ